MQSGTQEKSATGLMQMLKAQEPHIQAAMPRGFSSALHFAEIEEVMLQNSTYTPTEEVSTRNSFGLGKLLSLALLAGLGYWGYNTYMKNNIPTSSKVESSKLTPVPTKQLGVEALSKDVSQTMQTLEESLNQINDKDSALGALENITTATENLGKYADMLDKLPQGGKANILNIVNTAMPKIETAINKVGVIPGVGDVLRPIVIKLLGNVAKFR